MRVGRAALDEEAIRLIEEHNPDVEFDWTRILKGQGAETSRPAPRRERPERAGRRRHEPGASRQAQRFEPPPAKIEPEAPVEAAAPLPVPDEAESYEPEIEELPAGFLSIEDSALVGGVPDDAAAAEDIGAVAEGAQAEDRVTPAQARLGSEGVLRLRARHAEILARISERVSDSARAEELKAQAERLNPDTWVTADEVALGLEQYEAVFESLRAVVGRNRKRRRRRRRASTAPAAETAAKSAPGEEGEQEDDNDGEAEEL